MIKHESYTFYIDNKAARKELNILHISCLLLKHTGNERLVRIKKILSMALTSLQVMAKKDR